MSTTTRTRWLVGTVSAVGAAGLLAGGAALAQSDPPNLTGPCEGSATLSNGVVIDPAVSSGLYIVPLEGEADYEGALTTTVPTPRAVSGSVKVKTPPGIPDFGWSWNDTDATETSAEGTVDWSLPSWMPRDVTFTVKGVHQDTGATCEATVTVAVEGGVFDSPTTYVALAGTALAGAGVVAAGIGSVAGGAPAAPTATTGGGGTVGKPEEGGVA
jgi:hypothetical protein